MLYLFDRNLGHCAATLLPLRCPGRNMNCSAAIFPEDADIPIGIVTRLWRVRLYKELTDVERAFANLKDVIDLRPIYHRARRGPHLRCGLDLPAPSRDRKEAQGRAPRCLRHRSFERRQIRPRRRYRSRRRHHQALRHPRHAARRPRARPARRRRRPRTFAVKNQNPPAPRRDDNWAYCQVLP